jgi:hypothetical protein
MLVSGLAPLARGQEGLHLLLIQASELDVLLEHHLEPFSDDIHKVVRVGVGGIQLLFRVLLRFHCKEKCMKLRPVYGDIITRNTVNNHTGSTIQQ